MLCVKCKKDIPDGAPFCCWCGKKQAAEQKKTRRRSKQTPIFWLLYGYFSAVKKYTKRLHCFCADIQTCYKLKKTFAKTLDFVASLCYNIYRNKEHRAAKRSGHYDKDNDNNELAEV